MLNFLKTNKILLPVLVSISFFIFGVYIGQNNTLISQKSAVIDSITETQVDLTPFWKAWNAIDQKYPNAESVKSEQRVYGAISGLVDSLNDPYTVFFDPEETKLFEEDIAGNFSGVGMEVGIKDKLLTVIAPLKDTPAYKAGIKSGDKILKIDDVITSDMSTERAIKLIRGEKGTVVVLTILHDGESEPIEVSIERDIIDVPTLETEIRDDGIFVIRLFSFSANSDDLFRKAMKKFSTSKTDKLLLDLRGNPGGYLNASVDMASWFLDNGKAVVVEDYNNETKQKVYRSLGYNIFNDKLKFVILIDGGSASASEILAGAMQDHNRAKLVGTQSFGKGSVQEVVEITPDTILKVTVAKWLTPNGTSISEKGLTPDYKVEFTKKDSEEKKDPQMDKAVELLNNWTN